MITNNNREKRVKIKVKGRVKKGEDIELREFRCELTLTSKYSGHVNITKSNLL